MHQKQKIGKLPLSYYQCEDTLFLSRDLLGKYLFTCWDGNNITGGMIVETEAYMAPEDKASHAYGNRRTSRTEVMFNAGGVCYVYLCYGMHHLFNIVTHKHNVPHAILIRGLKPLYGIDTMLKRCHLKKNSALPTFGPARLSKALGIKTIHTGFSLTDNNIWLEDRGIKISSDNMVVSPRVGIDYAEEYASKPWRFQIVDPPAI